MAQRSRDQSRAVAEIGPLPPIADPERRAACERNLELFLTTYFPASTGLKPFSDDHRTVISRIQYCALEGGRLVNAVYRGFAKTTISENSAIWATAYGHRRFVPLFGADKAAAEDNLDSIKTELETNDLLLEDFPEICFPVRALEGKAQRCQSQTQNGRRTYVEWTASQIVLPTIYRDGKPTPSSGAILRTRGIEGASRGWKYKRPDGTQQRPDWVILDDIQTDASAISPEQCRKRLNILRKSICKAAGHNKAIAVVVNATVIEKEDMIDQLLSENEPAWQGVRIPMIRSWSNAHATHWLGEYARLRNTYDPNDPADQFRARRHATDYYRDHRDEMDAGCVVSWEHCYDDVAEISAIQHAYNFLIDDGEEVFASECQQQPIESDLGERALTREKILEKLSGRAARKIPDACEHVTAFVDVHDDLLVWTAVAWEGSFSGYVLDYGTYPDQKPRSFEVNKPKRTIRRAHGGLGLDGAIQAALQVLLTTLVAQQYKRDDGGTMLLDLGLIDAGYKPDVVHAAIKSSKVLEQRFRPSLGIPISAQKRPITDWKYSAGDRRGLHWGIFRKPHRPCPTVMFDANRWKSMTRDRILTPATDPGALTIYGSDPRRHAALVEHWTSEKPIPDEAQGLKIEKWELRPNRHNHLWDNLVGNAVAASILGCRTPGSDMPRSRSRRKRIKLSDLQRERQR